MNILHIVQSYFPKVCGVQEVVQQISERLQKMGHQVTVATTRVPERPRKVNGVNIVEFSIDGNLVEGIKGEPEAYQKFLLESQFDIIMVYAAQQWAADLIFPLLPKLNVKKIFVPCGFSKLSDPKYSSYYKQMRNEWLKNFDSIVLLSETYQDSQFIRNAGIEHTILIPNAASEEEFLQLSEENIRLELGIPEDHFLVLHLGSFSGTKGQREALKIFIGAEIEKSTLVFIGNIFDRRLWWKCRLEAAFFNMNSILRGSLNRIHLRTWNRKKTIAALRQSNLFLFPSMIECSPIVLFEAAAAGLPFLATNVGNISEILKWTEGGELIQTHIDERGYGLADIKDGARKLLQLSKELKRCEEMGKKAHKNWAAQYTWNKIAGSYASLYRDLLESKKICP